MGQDIVETLVTDDQIGSYQQSQLWHVLNEVLKSLTSCSTKFWLKKVLPKCIKCFMGSLKALMAEATVKPSKIKEVMNSVCETLRRSKKILGEAYTDALKSIHSDDLKAVIDQVASEHEKVQSIKSLAKQISSMLQPSDVTLTLKRKAEKTKEGKAKKVKQE